MGVDMSVQTAEKNIRVQEREERRQRVEAEQARLDRAAEARRNEKRVRQLAKESEQRIAAAIASGSTVTVTVPAQDATTIVTIQLVHEEQVVRGFARASVA